MALKYTLAAVPAIAVLTLAALANPAAAITRQQIILQFDPTPDDAFNADETRADDSIDDSGGPIDRALIAQIGQRNSLGQRLTPFVASGSVGEFGALGVEGDTGAVGELDAQVFIESDDFRNITGRAQQASALFIIDGGLVRMIGGQGSSFEFALTVRKDFDTVFQTAFEYVSLDSTGANNELTLFGDDIGIAETSPFQVDIPLAFVSADLGVIQPNETFGISYQLDITGTAVDFSEGMAFEFSDPFGVDLGDSVFPTVEFTDVQAVPLPATAPLLLGAFGLVGLIAKHRNRTTA